MGDHSLKHDGWVLIADGEKALFLRNKGDAAAPNLEVFREMEQENPPDREQGTDRPGRVHESAGPGRSAVEETDFHRIGKERFAKDIAARLYDYAHRGKFKDLIIVAPPLVLGEMRKELHKEVSDRVIAELPKELTNHPIHEIEKLLFKQS